MRRSETMATDNQYIFGVKSIKSPTILTPRPWRFIVNYELKKECQ